MVRKALAVRWVFPESKESRETTELPAKTVSTVRPESEDQKEMPEFPENRAWFEVYHGLKIFFTTIIIEVDPILS